MWRSEAHYNRGRALVELNTAHLAVDELQLALKLAPGRAHEYGPQLRRAVDLAPAHEKELKTRREMDLSEAPTIWYKWTSPAVKVRGMVLTRGKNFRKKKMYVFSFIVITKNDRMFRWKWKKKRLLAIFWLQLLPPFLTN